MTTMGHLKWRWNFFNNLISSLVWFQPFEVLLKVKQCSSPHKNIPLRHTGARANVVIKYLIVRFTMIYKLCDGNTIYNNLCMVIFQRISKCLLRQTIFILRYEKIFFFNEKWHFSASKPFYLPNECPKRWSFNEFLCKSETRLCSGLLQIANHKIVR